jgi:hypothetical protein
MTRAAAGRRLQLPLGEVRNEAKPRSRISMSRISRSRARTAPEPERPIKGSRTRQSVPEVSYPRLEPFKHVEVAIGDPADPQDVAEFEHIIYRSLREKENAIPPLRFAQEEITMKDRALLIDSVCRIQYKLQLATNSFYRFIGILIGT